MELVKFVYKDGFVKRCSRKEAEVLAMMGRGAIEEAGKSKPAAKPVAEVFKPVAPLVEETKAESVDEVPVEKPVEKPAEAPVKRRGRFSKA